MTTQEAGSTSIYSGLQIALHWIIAALIGVQYLISRAVELAFDQHADRVGATPSALAITHMAVGLLVLALAMLRLGVRLARPAPPQHLDVPWPARWLGHAVHFGLYGLLFALPLSGAVAWLLRYELAAELHEFGTRLLLLLVAAHTAGALVEHWFFRNDSMTRMIPVLPPPEPAASAEPVPK